MYQSQESSLQVSASTPPEKTVEKKTALPSELSLFLEVYTQLSEYSQKIRQLGSSEAIAPHTPEEKAYLLAEIEPIQTDISACIEKATRFLYFLAQEYTVIDLQNYWSLHLRYRHPEYQQHAHLDHTDSNHYREIVVELGNELYILALTLENHIDTSTLPILQLKTLFDAIIAEIEEAATKKLHALESYYLQEIVAEMKQNSTLLEKIDGLIAWNFIDAYLDDDEPITLMQFLSLVKNKQWFARIRDEISERFYLEIASMKDASPVLDSYIDSQFTNLIMPLASGLFAAPKWHEITRIGLEIEWLSTVIAAQLSMYVYTAGNEEKLPYQCPYQHSETAQGRDLAVEQARTYFEEYQESIEKDFTILSKLVFHTTDRNILQLFIKLNLEGLALCSDPTIKKYSTLALAHIAQVRELLGGRNRTAEVLYYRYFGSGGLLVHNARTHMVQLERKAQHV